MNDKLKMFLSDVVKLNDLSVSCADILFAFAVADAEIIEFTKEFKLKLLADSRLGGDNSLHNKLKELKDKGLLLNSNRKMYQLDSSLKQATDAIKQGEEVYIRVSYIETESTLIKQIAYVQETVESVTDTTTRRGRIPKPKPNNWQEIKNKILSGEITKTKATEELNCSIMTLNKWLAEDD